MKKKLPYLRPKQQVLLLKATELTEGKELAPSEFASIQDNPGLRACAKDFLSGANAEKLVEALLKDSELAAG